MRIASEFYLRSEQLCSTIWFSMIHLLAPICNDCYPCIIKRVRFIERNVSDNIVRTITIHSLMNVHITEELVDKQVKFRLPNSFC